MSLFYFKKYLIIFVSPKEFRKVAQLNNLVVRVGCFCNLGACQNALKFTDDDVLSSHEAGHVCGDDMDTLNGKPIGSIRVSFGYYSTKGITFDKIIVSRLYALYTSGNIYQVYISYYRRC